MTDKTSNKVDKINLLFVGVGGQGVLTASDIAAQVGLDLGLEAKKSEVHGFAQRGGVVESHVRWGPQVGSPTSETGTVDILVAFELLESVRWIEWLRPGGTVLVNTPDGPAMKRVCVDGPVFDATTVVWA